MALTVLNVSISPEPFQLVIDNVQRWDREIAKPALENTSHEK
jgi:hypothetical protein